MKELTMSYETIESLPKKKWKKEINDLTLFARLDNRYGSLGIPPRFENARMSNFPESYTDLVGKSLYIVGKSGRGKTHLMAALAFRQILVSLTSPVTDNVFARFISVSDLIARIKSAFNSCDTEETERELFDLYANAEWLYLDDLGAEQFTDWSFLTLYRIIDYRWNHMLPIVMTSNIPLKEIADGYGARIASRLMGMCKTVTMEGRDRRGANG